MTRSTSSLDRVTRTADPNKARIAHSEPARDSRRVKIAMRSEDTSIGQLAADFVSRLASDRERKRRRSRRDWGRAEEPDAS